MSNSQQDKLIKILKIWLKKNELDGDIQFYTIDEWKQRNEEYLNDSEFVITTEGGLNFMLNYGDSDEFYDLVDSFGYYCELGHSWNIGFYYDNIENEKKGTLTYSQKLKDYRWQNKRKYILERANNKCEDCNSTLNLQIHHCYYMYGYEPWEYPFDSFRCLCIACHTKRGLTEQVLRGHLASLKTNELDSLIHLVSTGLYWYPRKEIFSLLSSLKHNQTKMKKVFAKLLTKRFEQH